jgi:hypothetical protein
LRVESGEWKTFSTINFQFSTKNLSKAECRKWRVESGKWRMKKLSILNFQLSTRIDVKQSGKKWRIERIKT